MASTASVPGWLSVPDDANALAPLVWPADAVRDEAGRLVIGGRDAASLAAEFGTPLYVVDEADARAREEGLARVIHRHRGADGSCGGVEGARDAGRAGAGVGLVDDVELSLIHI